MVLVGLDVGSTTVKAVVVDKDRDILWKGYERHRTRQLDKVKEFFKRIQEETGQASFKLFTTGSGGSRIAKMLGTKHFQEVHALSTAVEYFHGAIGSIFELGGQDSKYVAWQGDKGRFVTMNDRCAGGTGATIDRILMKLNVSEDLLSSLTYSPDMIYSVAGKCGVFAETDINGLHKQGVPVDALILSLFQAIVDQNLAVLSRGYTPSPKVLLLGGPNVFFRALGDAFRQRLFSLWDERKISYGDSDVTIPENALFYGAMGAALLGLNDAKDGIPALSFHSIPLLIDRQKRSVKVHNGYNPFFANKREREDFYARCTKKPHPEVPCGSGEILHAYLGIDGGSTSTKGVVLDHEENVVATAYRLSGGNPIDDARDILLQLREKVHKAGHKLAVDALGFTGYAKDLLQAVFGGDAAIVETVAHTVGALKYFPAAEVICDVGGQDIKIITLKNGSIKDFKLNTQCSAGNGYYLQSTAERFGYRIEDYAEVAFRAKRSPSFNFGCAVFLEADIVNFQQLGWKPEEIMAGLARVLPQNVWLYVVREPNLARLGRRFVLQGGTHNNLAVVKAQYDFITSKARGAHVHVHPYNEVAGAIGAALEAGRRGMTFATEQRGATRSTRTAGSSITPPASKFIGFDELHHVQCRAEKSERTRCRYCSNSCQRTFITVTAGSIRREHIIAGCEKGIAGDRDELRRTIDRMERMAGSAPNFVHISNQSAFQPSSAPPQAPGAGVFRKKTRKYKQLIDAVVGIPRLLNLYVSAPFFKTYFECLGVKDVVFSGFTSEPLYRKTAGRGSIDPCFPSKIAIAHVYDLVHRPRVTHIFFPCVRTVRAEVFEGFQHWACAALSATPEVVKAAFTLERDEFSVRGIHYLDPVLDIAELDVLEKQLHTALRPLWGIGRDENRRAIEAGLKSWDTYLASLQCQAEQTIAELERRGDIGIVVLGRPYHNDPGINHGILDELNRCGYPVLTIESLPRNGHLAKRLFGEDIVSEKISCTMDIRDVWSRCYSENTSMKVWAAKFVARHPNLVALDLSSFRCGHDAPLYSVLDDIFNQSSSPYFTFHEIDENRPSSSIKLRVETIDYFLKRYREELSRCTRFSLAV